MGANDHTQTIDLARLALSPGQGRRYDVTIAPSEIELGGTDYAAGAPPLDARLDVSRTAAGHALRLRFTAELAGPCNRCLGDATLRVDVDAREVDQPSSRDEELLSPYVTEEVLALDRWAHDALALAVPTQVLCRDDCAGLCPECGESLNDAPAGAHDHPPEPDPRWAKLRELELE